MTTAPKAAKVVSAVGDEPPRLRKVGAADFRRGLARIGRARAAGAGSFVVAWSTKYTFGTGMYWMVWYSC